MDFLVVKRKRNPGVLDPEAMVPPVLDQTQDPPMEDPHHLDPLHPQELLHCQEAMPQDQDLKPLLAQTPMDPL